MEREPDAHLNPAELEALLHPGEPLAGAEEADVFEARNHVVSCDQCQSLLELHAGQERRLAQLKARPVAPRASACPPESQWLNLAAGLARGREAETLLDHAAACDHCGLLLRQSVADLAEDATAEEEQFLARLESVWPEWQEHMAARLASEACRAEDPGLLRRILRWLRRPLFPRAPVPRWAYAAFTALAATLVLIVLPLGRPPVEDLLATAYTAQRTLELRVPQAAYGPLRLVRGPTASPLDRPPELLEAEARIARELAENPNDPRWLQARGRAELLARDFSAALADLQRCRTLRPDSRELMTDLACAYFGRAEAQNSQQDYSAALDLLNRVLQIEPNDPVALFNRAIVYQRLHRYDQAREDWRHYLRVDPNGKWAEEAGQRLAETH